MSKTNYFPSAKIGLALALVLWFADRAGSTPVKSSRLRGVYQPPPKLLVRRVLKRKKSQSYYAGEDDQDDFVIPCEVQLQLKKETSGGMVFQDDYATFLYEFCQDNPKQGLACAEDGDFWELDPRLQRLFVASSCRGGALQDEECLEYLSETGENFGFTKSIDDLCEATYKLLVPSGLLCYELDEDSSETELEMARNFPCAKSTDVEEPDEESSFLVDERQHDNTTASSVKTEPNSNSTGTPPAPEEEPASEPERRDPLKGDASGEDLAVPSSANQNEEPTTDRQDGDKHTNASGNDGKSGSSDKEKTKPMADGSIPPVSTNGVQWPGFDYEKNNKPESAGGKGLHQGLALSFGVAFSILLLFAVRRSKNRMNGSAKRIMCHEDPALDGDESIVSDNSFMFRERTNTCSWFQGNAADYTQGSACSDGGTRLPGVFAKLFGHSNCRSGENASSNSGSISTRDSKSFTTPIYGKPSLMPSLDKYEEALMACHDSCETDDQLSLSDVDVLSESETSPVDLVMRKAAPLPSNLCIDGPENAKASQRPWRSRNTNKSFSALFGERGYTQKDSQKRRDGDLAPHEHLYTAPKPKMKLFAELGDSKDDESSLGDDSTQSSTDFVGSSVREHFKEFDRRLTKGFDSLKTDEKGPDIRSSGRRRGSSSHPRSDVAALMVEDKPWRAGRSNKRAPAPASSTESIDGSTACFEELRGKFEKSIE